MEIQGDRYGRTDRRVLFLLMGYNLNARLVYEGLALAYRKYSKKYMLQNGR